MPEPTRPSSARLAILSAAALGITIPMAAAAPAARVQDRDPDRRSDTVRTQPGGQRPGQSADLDRTLDRMTGTWNVSLSLAPDLIGAWSPDAGDSVQFKVEGFATIERALGGTMLREAFYTDDGRLMHLSQRGTRDTDERRAPRGDTAGERPRTPIDQDDPAELVTVAWFDIDPETQRYAIASIGNGMQKITHGEGRLQLTGNRLIFMPAGDESSAEDDEPRDAGPVVVEWESADRFTVTQYRRRLGGDRARGMPIADRPATEPGSLEENVIYRAVHERASDEERREMRERIRTIDDRMRPGD